MRMAMVVMIEMVMPLRKKMMMVVKRRDVGDGLAQHHVEEV